MASNAISKVSTDIAWIIAAPRTQERLTNPGFVAWAGMPKEVGDVMKTDSFEYGPFAKKFELPLDRSARTAAKHHQTPRTSMTHDAFIHTSEDSGTPLTARDFCVHDHIVVMAGAAQLKALGANSRGSTLLLVRF